MHIKKIALRAMVLGMVAVAVMAHNQPVHWESPCTDAAIVANWSKIRTQLATLIEENDDGKLSKDTRKKVFKLLGNSYYLPTAADLKLEKQLFALV
ncbi:hypothetical protein FBU31_005068, partial [Coemansia sp. 'formosensis']